MSTLPEVRSISVKRFAIVFVPAALVAAALAVATAQGAIGASMVISGDSFKISAKTFKASGFAQYGRTLTARSGTKTPVATALVRTGLLYDMCQSVVMNSPVGVITLRLSAGGGDKPVVAKNLVADATRITGDSYFAGFEGGIDAGTLTTVPGMAGARGSYSQRARTALIRDFKQVTWGTAAATFKLPGLRVAVERGRRECF